MYVYNIVSSSTMIFQLTLGVGGVCAFGDSKELIVGIVRVGGVLQEAIKCDSKINDQISVTIQEKNLISSEEVHCLTTAIIH